MDTRAQRGRLLAAISNTMVRLYAELYGRGPTRAKTFWQDDVVCVVLEDVYTSNERTLIEAGHEGHVRRTRELLQEAVRDRFTAAIEEVTGRSVRAYLSETQARPDVSVEVFLLVPQPAL